MKPEELLYARTHEWVHVLPDAQGAKIATVGISAFAVEALTDLVYLELPKVGRQLKGGESFGEVESVKAVSDLYCPVSGEVVEVNRELPENLHWLTEDPYGRGWIARIKISNEQELKAHCDYATYQQHCAEESH